MKISLPFILFSLLVTILNIPSFSQESKGTLKGSVTDSLGNPLPVVSVTIKNTTLGTSTDNNGIFTIKNIPTGNYTVETYMIGFKTTSRNVTIKAGETTEVNLTLKEDILALDEVVIDLNSKNGMGHLRESEGTVIFSGKKTEVLVLDSLDANTAQNNPRQILGRVPGMNFSETEGNGFPSNGIGSRGLNPTQSIEMNTRQNGYNITSDIFGYNEAYYNPPMDAVERIELVRGASSLQFGPQFGGMVNYVMKGASKNKPFEFNTLQTYGSFNSFTSSNSVGGTIKKFSYYAFGQYKSSQGWRQNSDYRSFSGYSRIQYQVNEKIKVGLEYSILRNKIHMAGGLTDSQFYADSRKSYRSRNWLNSPWNIITGTLDYKISHNTSFSIKSTYLFSQRNLVWKNEDGGPGAIDSTDGTGNFTETREVEKELFNSSTTEARLLTHYKIGKTENTLATGVRIFAGNLKRDEGGPGSTGTNFDLNLYGGGFEKSLTFQTTNLAYFVENIFRITSRLSVTPGFRFEYIRSTAKGYITDDAADSILNVDKARNRYIPLFGLGTQYRVSPNTTIYGNISQAYRPMDYSSLTPIGVASRIDPNIKDAYGFNSDLGYRGTVKNYLNFDISLFYLQYNRRVGLVALTDAGGNPYTLRTNVANSVHKGIEAYVEFNPVKAFAPKSTMGNISIFNSIAYVDARYVSANPNLVDEDGNPLKIKGNRVEYAPKVINRTGITYAFKGFSITYLISYTGKSYSDATNTVYSSDAVIGVIPSYKVMDLSAMYKYKNYIVKAGINNLADVRYFTKRTDEYPGPGIIPSQGRSFYLTVGAKF